MRDEASVEAFAVSRQNEVDERRLAYEVAMFRAGVPQLYWFVSRSEIKHNVSAFSGKVLPYRRRLARAFKNGYGLLFTGDNGTGKTFFISYLLGRAAQKQYSIYYTTLKGLDIDIKRGYDEPGAGRRLRAALGSDFVAIDELGKEHARSAHLVAELEHVVKSRYDDGYPTLLASNLSLGDLGSMYGPTLMSMMDGRFSQVQLEGGDFRAKIRTAMSRDMEYK